MARAGVREVAPRKTEASRSPHRGVRDRAEYMATASSTTARNLRVAETYTDVRGGVKKPVKGSATTEQGLRCLTSADRHVGVGMGVS